MSRENAIIKFFDEDDVCTYDSTGEWFQREAKIRHRKLTVIQYGDLLLENLDKFVENPEVVLKDGKRLLRNFAVGDRWFIWPLEIIKGRIIKHKFKFGDYFCNDAKKRYAFEFVFSVFKHKSEFRNALEYYIDDNLKTNCQSHCQFCRTGVVTFSNRDKVFYFD